MNRFKTLGIAAVMALALSALGGVASASASSFLNPGAGAGESRTWSGTKTGANHVLQLPNDYVSCNSSSLTGTLIGPSGKEVVLSPQFGGCKLNGYLEANFTNHGCAFRLLPGTGSGGSSTGSLGVVGCSSPMTFQAGSCVIEIGNQHGVGSVKYERTEENSAVKMTATLSGLEFTRWSGGACFGATGTFTASYSGEWLVKGSNSKGEPKSIGVEGTSEGTGPTNFAAEEAPVKILGEKSTAIPGVFAVENIGVLSCTVHALKGESATVTATTIAVTPTYSGCKFQGLDAKSVSMGGCSYVYHVNGTVDIVGATCASNPITFTSAYEPCTVTVGPQSGLGLSLSNEGTGKTRSVNTAGEAPGLVSTAGPGCGVPGTENAGFYKSKDKFTATNSLGSPQGFWVE